MARADVDAIVGRGDAIAREIEAFVANDPKSIEFRADLAGLLVVAIVASYESCVKETLINYAAKHHKQFAIFAQNHFDKMNSRISISDLYNYARTFDNVVHHKFGETLTLRRDRIFARTGKDFKGSYTQLLGWRHAFAHAGIRNTTVEEAITTHRLAKRVLYVFDDAFESHSNLT